MAIDTGSPNPRAVHHSRVRIDADVDAARPLPPKHSAGSKERLNVHIMRRHLTDDLLVDARPSLRTRIALHGSIIAIAGDTVKHGDGPPPPLTTRLASS
jgi:hypothetical protein